MTFRTTRDASPRRLLPVYRGATTGRRCCPSFCCSPSPWKPGTMENSNGLRDYLANGADLRVHPAEHVPEVDNERDIRRWRVLGDRTPGKHFRAPLTSQNQSVLQRCLEPTRAKLDWYSHSADSAGHRHAVWETCSYRACTLRCSLSSTPAAHEPAPAPLRHTIRVP
jgi:hypothetical protein